MFGGYLPQNQTNVQYIYLLCTSFGLSRVICGHTSPLTMRIRPRGYFRSECCTGGRLLAVHYPVIS